MKNIFIIGSKGIPAQYGGFETFVEKLTEGMINENIKYHVACMSDNTDEYEYNGAHCFNISVPNIGAAKAVFYDCKAFVYCLNYIKKNNINDAIVYVLACRIGPFIKILKNALSNLGGTLFVNPDGHEWKRAKWNKAIKRYWKMSERLMVKYADLLICDSSNIEKYIRKEYRRFSPKTKFIAYGADISKCPLTLSDPKVRDWYDNKHIKENSYYLVVGRFVPENNYESMIKGFMKSRTRKDLVIITNVEHNKFYVNLKEKTMFDTDPRIKFVGTVYDQELLSYIRENAFGYIHGHEVGGTNPSLLEALASTPLNLLLDVGFNKEVGRDGALYWSKESNSLSTLLNKVDNFSQEQIELFSRKAKARISSYYNWKNIIAKYEDVWLNENKEDEKNEDTSDI